MTAVLIFGSGLVLSVVWLVFETRLRTPVVPPTSMPPPVVTVPLASNAPLVSLPAPDPEEMQRGQRQALLDSRGKLELAARDAAGTPIRVEFQQSGMEVLRIKDGETEYSIQVSIASSMGAWIFPATNETKSIYISKTTEHGKPIDIRQIRPSKMQDTFQIGEHAFVALASWCRCHGTEQGSTPQRKLVL